MQLSGEPGSMWYSYRELIYRVGTFFLMVGFGLVLLFILSEAAQKVAFSYFCWGLVLLIVGVLFRTQYRKSFPPNDRFSFLKRLMPKSKKDKGK
jgi:predicted membrane channel-forming protein YqfA (hemolysin III family)